MPAGALANNRTGDHPRGWRGATRFSDESTLPVEGTADVWAPTAAKLNAPFKQPEKNYCKI
jgi:hypothetical protein